MNVFVNCWSVLELDSDADERSIKRQYARLLKTNRPDEDPAAFQRLREAYEQAMAMARNRSEVLEEATPAARPMPIRQRRPRCFMARWSLPPAARASSGRCLMASPPPTSPNNGGRRPSAATTSASSNN